MEIKVDNESVEKIVEQHIRAGVAKALSQKSDYLIGQLVEGALKRKHNHYDRLTVWEAAVDKAIMQAANEAAQDWLDEQKPKIKALVARKLAAKSRGLMASIADQLVAQLRSGITAKVWLSGSDD